MCILMFFIKMGNFDFSHCFFEYFFLFLFPFFFSCSYYTYVDLANDSPHFFFVVVVF